MKVEGKSGLFQNHSVTLLRMRNISLMEHQSDTDLHLKCSIHQYQIKENKYSVENGWMAGNVKNKLNKPKLEWISAWIRPD